jgi:hypothetical protein
VLTDLGQHTTRVGIEITSDRNAMGKFFERLATILIVLAALAVGGSAIRREFFSESRAAARVNATKPELTTSYLPDWERMKALGTWYGDSLAPVTIVEFLDYECPYCARFHESLKQAVRETTQPVALHVVQFPLLNHRFAMPSAVAAECAARQGRFGAMTDVLFARQDSLGLKTWTSYAADAGVRDTIGFSKCLKLQPAERIIASRNFADSARLGGTPTVIINGWHYSRPPTTLELKEALKNPRRPPGSIQ